MTGSAVSQAPMDRLRELRARRGAVRRTVELARLRAQQGGPTDGLADAEAELARLTDALIDLYRSDLALVDSLLDPAYPADGKGRGTP